MVVEEDESSYEDNDIESVRGEIRGTEIGDNAIEEAKNEPQAAAEKVTPEIEEEVTKPDPIVEDLTTPKSIITVDVIEDWEERMNRANYTSEQRHLVN